MVSSTAATRSLWQRERPMTTTMSADSIEVRPAVDLRHLRNGVWLLPVFGALTLWATITHQPDPTTEFSSWARFVTTDEFLAKHLLGSILGLALNTIGVAALELPGVTEAKPLVRVFDLVAVVNSLAENAEFVANSITDRGDLQRGERIHVAGRQST